MVHYFYVKKKGTVDFQIWINVSLRIKTYSYLIGDDTEGKKTKVTKKCVIKWKVKFENYENCLEGSQPENRINHLEKKKKYRDLKNIIKNL